MSCWHFNIQLCLFSFHRVFSLSSFSPSLCHPSSAHLHPRRCSSPSDHLAGTQLRNCASRQMPCRTVGDGGGGVMQSPSMLPLFLSPSPGLPAVLTLNTPPSFSPALSSQACPSQPGEQWRSCVCRLFPTITFNYGSLQCGLVKGLAIRSLSLSLPHTLSSLAQFWSLARLHVKTTQIAPCSLYTPHSSLYVSLPQPEYLTGTLLIHIFHSLPFPFFPLILSLPPPGLFFFSPPSLPPSPVSSSQSSFIRVFLHRDMILFVVVGEFRGNTDNGYREMGSSLVV